ncbi:hypothetical protein [uncultured Rothia sp.]|uniref:hypothetical protein n=1 Tax=uncultured Rothia sp. TaxID=316088 RepID=UPI003216579A
MRAPEPLKHYVWESIPGAKSVDEATEILQKVQQLKRATGQEDLNEAFAKALEGSGKVIDTIAFVFRNIGENIASVVNTLAAAGFEELTQEDFEVAR